MAKYIFKRLVHVFFTLFVFKSLAFCAGGGSSASPGDQLKAIRGGHFDTLRFSDDYPDSVSIHLFNGEKELSECLKDSCDLKKALTDTTEGSPLSSTKEFKHGEVNLGSEGKLSFVVSYKVPTLGPAGKFFEDFVSTYCGSPAVAEDVVVEDKASPPMKKVFESAVFSVPVTFKGSTVSRFTALISYGEAWRYISPSHIEDFGFRSLSVAGLFEGEDYIKKVEWESVAPGNKRKDSSQVRYPTTSGELCLERLESKIKTIECKTVIGDRPLEASRDRLKFSMSKRQRPKDGGGSDLKSTLVTLVSICNGLVKLYNEPSDPALEQLFLGDGYLPDDSVATIEDAFIATFKSKKEPCIFLDWNKFRGLTIKGFKFKDRYSENEQKLLGVFKSAPDFNFDLDIEVVSSPEEATKYKIRDIISTPPVRLPGSEWQAYLESGRWKKISSDMVERKRRFIRNRISDQGDYSLLNFDPAVDDEDEGKYNKRVASIFRGSPGTIMLNLDRVTSHSVPVSKEAKTSRKRKLKEEKTEVIKFEFCDLLLSKSNGKLYAIHVKRMSDSWDSATLSHLFAQGNVSASIVKNEHRTFRDHMLKGLGIGDIKVKEKIEAGDFTIVFAIVAPKGETAVKSFDGLPYIAVHQLYDTIMQVESRGFPCQLTIINRATAPMAGAGGGSSGRGGSSLDSWLTRAPSTTTGS